MQTQDKEIAYIASSVQKSKRVPLFTGIGMLIVLTLLVGIGVTVLAYSHTLHNSITAPKAGTWQRVLSGYSIVSLTAAPSNPTILYACGTPRPSTPIPYRPNQPTISYTLLRSADSGTTWQQVTNLIADCQLAINSVQSDDIYVIGLAGHLAGNGQVPTALRHSTDSGRSWTDIAPTIDTGNPQLSIPWHIQQLTIVGNHLFGLQLLPTARVQPIGKPSPISVVTQLDLSRLVESSDGGHTWSIVDGNLNVTGQGTYDYIVSPSDSQTMYELVGSGWFPYSTPLMPDNTSTSGINLSLYKTTNGGGTWTKLFDNIEYGSKIQVANNNPALVFVGESTSTLSPTGPDIPPLARYFSLAVSKDGGATWNTIEKPSEASLIQNWFVSADGQIYTATGIAESRQPTGTIGTVDPIGTKQIKPVGTVVSGNPEVSSGDVTATIQRYDPASNRWSSITKAPVSGILLAVTASATSHRGATLWFLSDADNAQVLYREVL